MPRSTAALIILATLTLTTPASAGPPDPADTLRAASEVLDELDTIPAKCIPRAVLADAQAVAIIPGAVRAGLLIGGRAGHGVVVIRDRDGGWGEVRFLTLGGASLGFQAGVERADVVLVFRTRRGLDRLLEGRRKLTLGADAAVAAGPVGRDAEAATDARLRAEVLSYSRSRGLFAGVALAGVVLAPDGRTTEAFERHPGPEAVKAADGLKRRLAMMTAGRPPAGAVPVRPPE